MALTLYASCNIEYFLQHGLALATSAAKNQTKLVLEIFPSIDNSMNDAAERFMREWVAKRDVSIYEWVDIRLADTKLYFDLARCLDIKDLRSFYASYRFLNLPKMLLEYPELLVIDVDAIVNKPVTIPTGYDFGLYLREPDPNLSEYEREGMRVAAGAVYVTRGAQKFVKEIQNYMMTNSLQWFVDQRAIWEAYQKCQDLKFYQIPKSLIDWDFNPDSMIFTAKGPRKDSQVWKDITSAYIKKDTND